MDKPLYTFLLPAYKAKYLEEALSSIKYQTFGNFRAIVSDDCSPEDLRSCFDKVCVDDPRFIYRRNKENIGCKSLVAHWNKLVSLCETDYFIMASDDDVYEPTFLEEINNLSQKYTDVDLFRARCKKIDGNGMMIAMDLLYEEFMHQLDFVHVAYNSDFIACEANYCYRTKAFKENGGFVEFPSAWFTDYATFFLMSKNGCCCTKDALFRFRCSDINITSQWGNPEDSKKKTQACISFYNWMKEFMQSLTERLERTPLNKAKVNRIEQRYKSRIAHHFQNHIYHCKWKSFWLLYKSMPDDIGLSQRRVLLHYLKNRIK